MSDKVNLVVAGEELTVYFGFVSGPRAPCFYCHQPGSEQLVVLYHIETSSGIVLSAPDKRFVTGKATLERELLHRRAVCQADSSCANKHAYAQFASTEVIA